MEKLIKVNNEWVKEVKEVKAFDLHSWLREKAEAHKQAEVKEVEIKVKENGCKTYDEIVDSFKNDEPRPEVYKLSRKWQDKVTLGQDLKELRALLGWPLYQEWLRETITG